MIQYEKKGTQGIFGKKKNPEELIDEVGPTMETVVDEVSVDLLSDVEKAILADEEVVSQVEGEEYGEDGGPDVSVALGGGWSPGSNNSKELSELNIISDPEAQEHVEDLKGSFSGTFEAGTQHSIIAPDGATDNKWKTNKPMLESILGGVLPIEKLKKGGSKGIKEGIDESKVVEELVGAGQKLSESPNDELLELKKKIAGMEILLSSITGKAMVCKPVGKITTEDQNGVVTEMQEDLTPAMLVGPTINVGMSLGFTKQTIKYSNVKAQVSLNIPCRINDLSDTFEFITSWVDGKITELYESDNN